jgi:hypothetical protein
MDDWSNIAYLQYGAERQQAAYRALIEADIFTVLAEYDPTLVGTIPLGLDVDSSDLDVLCYASDLNQIADDLEYYYKAAPGFELTKKTFQDHPSIVCRFVQNAFTIEVFAQPIPVKEQRAFRHMVVEAKLLRLGGEGAQVALRHMKHAGISTEDAFSRYFLIPGEPYAALLALYDATYVELVELVAHAAHRRDSHATPG